MSEVDDKEDDLFSISGAFGNLASVSPDDLAPPLSNETKTFGGLQEFNGVTTKHQSQNGKSKVSASSYLHNICVANGLDPASVELDKVESLEIFQVLQFRQIAGLDAFTGLKSLEIIQQPHVARIENLTSLSHLQKLYLSDNSIDKMTGLETLTELEELHLDANNIRKLEGLETLTKLRVLHVNNNQISIIEGLDTLTNLTHLNLASNTLEFVGGRLAHLTKLQELNLANNRIGSFSEIRNLSRLASLQVLSLSDAHYGDNPVCALCNYYTYALYHLRFLHCLDSIRITADAVALAEATYLKKQMYYNMRIKMCKRATSNLARNVTERLRVRLRSNGQAGTSIMNSYKAIDRELSGCVGSTSACTLSSDELLTARQSLDKATAVLQQERQQAATQLQDFSQALSRTSEQLISRMVLEMESGGNIRYEDGQPNDVWMKTSVKFARSRFAVTKSLQERGVGGLRVRRVTKLHNRFLRNRLEEKLEMLRRFSPSNPEREKPELHYMFCSLDEPTDPTMRESLSGLLDMGFSTPDQPSNAAVASFSSPSKATNAAPPLRRSPISGKDKHSSGSQRVKKKFAGRKHVRDKNKNSGHSSSSTDVPILLATHLGHCDRDVIARQADTSTGPVLARSNLLIVKVFLGETATRRDDEPIRASAYPNVDSVMETLTDPSLQPDAESEVRPTEAKMCSIFDQAMMLPEYLLEVDYLRSGNDPVVEVETLDAKTAKAASSFVGLLSPVLDLFPTSLGDETGTNVAVRSILQQLPSIPSPRLQLRLSEEDGVEGKTQTEFELVPAADPGSVDFVSLHNMKLGGLPAGLEQLQNLRVLVLTFNKLHSFPTVIAALPQLDTLELSYNAITGVGGVAPHAALTCLRLDHNNIASLPVVKALGVLFPNLVELDLGNNPLTASVPDVALGSGLGYMDYQLSRQGLDYRKFSFENPSLPFDLGGGEVADVPEDKKE